MKKTTYSRCFKYAACIFMAILFLIPLDVSGEPRRKRRADVMPPSEAAKADQMLNSSSNPTTSIREKRNQDPSNQRNNQNAAGNSKPASTAKKSNPPKPSAAGAKRQQVKKRLPVETPNLDEIKDETLDPKKEYYYPNLMKKYLSNDTVRMHPLDFKYLYLGYMFQEDYDPYRQSPYTQKTDSLLQLAPNLKDLTRAQKMELKSYAERSLDDNPFDLRQMSLLIQVLKELNKGNSALVWTFRLQNIVDVIRSTGSGINKDNAMFVIYPMHEYDIIELMGYEAVDVEFIEPFYDHLKVKLADGNRKVRNPATGFYFNIQYPQYEYEIKHPEDIEGSQEVEEDDEDQAWN